MELGEIAANLKDQLKENKADNKYTESNQSITEVKREPKRDNLGRANGIGRRKKNAIARVWIFPGKGKITINKKTIEEYFFNDLQRMDVLRPLKSCNVDSQFDILCNVKGGGLSGQSGAIKLAIARALVNYDPDSYHKTLKKCGYLTRDARIVERKKYGQHKARKKTQFSKR